MGTANKENENPNGKAKRQKTSVKSEPSGDTKPPTSRGGGHGGILVPAEMNGNSSKPPGTLEPASMELLLSNTPSSSHPAGKRKRSPSLDPLDDDNMYIATPVPISTVASNMKTPQQVRAALRRIVESKEMTIKALCETLDVSQPSYRRFMSMYGRDKGEFSDTYAQALPFLHERKLAGKKTPAKPRLSKEKEQELEERYDVSGIKLDEWGEEREASGTVPIFETCDGVRKQINAHLRQSGRTKAALQRVLQKQLPDDEEEMASNMLTRFLTHKHGPVAGAGMPVYYAAYIYFEKLRIKQGKSKSEWRLRMEEAWNDAPEVRGELGVPRRDTTHAYFTSWSPMYIDEYGRHVETGR